MPNVSSTNRFLSVKAPWGKRKNSRNVSARNAKAEKESINPTNITLY